VSHTAAIAPSAKRAIRLPAVLLRGKMGDSVPDACLEAWLRAEAQRRTAHLRAALVDIARTFGAAVLAEEVDALGGVLSLLSRDNQLAEQRRHFRRGIYVSTVLHDLAITPGYKFEVDDVRHLARSWIEIVRHVVWLLEQYKKEKFLSHPVGM
jgi:hypothetical protein